MNKHFPEHRPGVVLVMMCHTAHAGICCPAPKQIGLFERGDALYSNGHGYFYDNITYNTMRDAVHSGTMCDSKLEAWLGALKECNKLNAACLRYRHRWEGARV